MMYTSDSDDSSSSDSDDDIDLLFFETCFATTRELGTRINLQDISEDTMRKCSGDIFVLCVLNN